VIKNKDINSYLFLDDYYVMGIIKSLSNTTDKLLSTLCQDILNRKLFDSYEINKYFDNSKYIINTKLESKDFENYLYYDEQLSQVLYSKTDNLEEINTIKILLNDNTIISLDEYSIITKSLIETSKQEVRRVYRRSHDI
ncbi:MAG: hypothetical protein ACRC5M_03185, partial [Anaeroplasmataceae bacterium]